MPLLVLALGELEEDAAPMLPNKADAIFFKMPLPELKLEPVFAGTLG